MSASNPSTSGSIGYAGDITPQDAWAQFQQGEAVLIDVRTPEELKWVGRVPGAIPVPWLIDNGQRQNPDFLTQLKAAARPDQKVLLLCRSGVRSELGARAATEAGYASVWSVINGFEGPLDDNQHRNRIGGWRHAGLPWEQA
ncbi:MAG: rhodanese-like domain-containing protein [Lautropia sp.]|nr:rhodanese-like domain-containing protein [Lautropia sp.]